MNFTDLMKIVKTGPKSRHFEVGEEMQMLILGQTRLRHQPRLPQIEARNWRPPIFGGRRILTKIFKFSKIFKNPTSKF